MNRFDEDRVNVDGMYFDASTPGERQQLARERCAPLGRRLLADLADQIVGTNPNTLQARQVTGALRVPESAAVSSRQFH